MGITSQILQNMFWTAKRRLRVDHPVLRRQVVQECGKGLVVCQWQTVSIKHQLLMFKSAFQTFQKHVAKNRAEYLHGQEEIGWRGDPAGVIGRQSTSRYHIVNMGVALQGLSPGMQDAEESDLGAKTTLGIGSHFPRALVWHFGQCRLRHE